MESAMNISRLVLVTALGLGLSSTGCLGNTDPLVEDIGPPHSDRLIDPGGGVGPNGLMPSEYHANLIKLLNATYAPLLQGEGLDDFSAQLDATGILLTVPGQKTLQYAWGCAFPDNFDRNINGIQYRGEGLLETTASWAANPGTGLSLQGRKDLFACVAASLNPYGDDVDVLHIGEDVHPNNDENEAQFSFNEALWIVKMVPTVVGATSILMPNVHVWPLRDAVDLCRPVLEDTFQSRYCGLGLKDCGLEVRTDGSACTQSNEGFYWCDGEPAIKTKLDPYAVSKLYGGCAL
jgi:hypothetical protein